MWLQYEGFVNMQYVLLKVRNCVIQDAFTHLGRVGAQLRMLLRLFATLVAVNGIEAGAGGSGGFAFVVPFEGPVDVKRADVADGDAVDVLGIHRPDEYAPFIAGADERHTERLGQAAATVAVAEVGRAEAGPADDAQADDVLEELAAVGVGTLARVRRG